MIQHLSIASGEEFARTSRLLLEAARSDVRILCIDRGSLGELLVFCRDAADAEDVAGKWERNQKLDPSLSSIEIVASAKIILVHQQGIESQERLAGFLSPLLQRLRPLHIFDTEEEVDVSNADDSVLFGNEG